MIYLDFNASTPIAPEVQAAMAPLLAADYGNPSSTHWARIPARHALDRSRGDVAALLGASPDEIVFTSGGSEANNTALKGIYFRSRNAVAVPHVITTQIEHPAILSPCNFLESRGARVTRLPVDATGLVDPAQVRDCVTPQTVLVSVMHANNEVGTVQPLAEIGAIARERGIPFHTDAAQTFGKLATRVDNLGVDLLSIAGHKCYAPKGVGALYVRKGLDFEPLVHGVAHEGGRRAGTESVLLAAGLGAACRLPAEHPCTDRLADLTSYFWNRLVDVFGSGVVLNGHARRRLPNTLNVSFPSRLGHELLGRLDGVAGSTGSACHSGSDVMSPVLQAMGCTPDVGLGAIRFSTGRTTTRDEIDRVVDLLTASVATGS